jgi:hypothetical protein
MDLFPYFRSSLVVQKMCIFERVLVIIKIDWNYEYRKNGHWRANKYSEGSKWQRKKPSNQIRRNIKHGKSK